MKCSKMQFTVKIVHLLDFSCSYQTMWNFPRLNVYNWVGERLFLIHNIAVVVLIRVSPVGSHDLHFMFNPDQKSITWKYHSIVLLKQRIKFLHQSYTHCYQIVKYISVKCIVKSGMPLRYYRESSKNYVISVGWLGGQKLPILLT